MMLIEISLFRRIVATICCIFGLPGNILTIIVCMKALCQRTINFERKVFNLYLVEISILDTFLLLYWIIETLLDYYSTDENEHFSLMHISAFSCYFFYMVNRLFAALCSWLITCFTLIRFLNIFRRFNTIRSNIILVTCLTIIFSLANSYLMVTLGYHKKQNIQSNESFSNNTNDQSLDSTSCHIREEYIDNSVTLLLNTLVAGFLNLVLPSMLTFIVNVAIVCYIKHIYKAKKSEPIQRRPDQVGTNYRSSRSTLLVISITYTLCYLPYCIIYLIVIKFEEKSRILSYWSDIAFILRYISHSVNFYAYIFTNHSFRRDIILLLRYIFRLCPHITIHTQHKQGIKHRNIIFHHYRSPPTTPSNNSAAKMICLYQRPTCIRFHQQNTGQQNIQTNEIYYNKQNTLLATVSPTNSSEKYRKGTRI